MTTPNTKAVMLWGTRCDVWARHDAPTPVHLDHPQVGELRLNREKLGISSTEGQMLAIYHLTPALTAPTNWHSSPPPR